MSAPDKGEVWRTFRALVESADRKFGRVREAAPYGRVREFQKVFKAYMRVWKYQQEQRPKLVAAGLSRWEIGEIASRIGQLYFGQYLRTSQSRFLAESCVFYEAILSRSYFHASHLSVRFKELRFFARFLLVAFLLCRTDLVTMLFHRFSDLLEESRATFRDTNFKEWRQVIDEASRFMKADTAFSNMRPLRYCPAHDSHPHSAPHLGRFHAKKLLKFQDAMLAGYHRNEVKFADITLDAFRMMQCLEWDPAGSLFHPQKPETNGGTVVSAALHSGPSGLIDINQVGDPTLPPNPRKAVLYRPSLTHLIAVMATICEELPPDCVILVYLSASGNVSSSSSQAAEGSSLPRKDGLYDRYLWFGPGGRGGSNKLYPGDFVPFTRRPLFLIVDSDTSHAFKVLHGAERGEPAALLLSPLRPAFHNPPHAHPHGSQFTFFLTAPLAAFAQLAGVDSQQPDVCNDAEDMLTAAFSEWEVILCTSTSLDLVWGQVLCDPFLRRLILRFIFCRAVVFHFCGPEDSEQCLPTCLPPLPDSVSPECQVVKAAVVRVAKHMRVEGLFSH